MHEFTKTQCPSCLKLWEGEEDDVVFQQGYCENCTTKKSLKLDLIRSIRFSKRNPQYSTFLKEVLIKILNKYLT